MPGDASGCAYVRAFGGSTCARAPRTTFAAGLPGMGWLLPSPKMCQRTPAKAHQTPLTCKAMLRSEADKFANPIATEGSVSSRHLKDSAVPNTCPSAIGIFTALRHPKFRQGKTLPPSLKPKWSHEVIPVRNPREMQCFANNRKNGRGQAALGNWCGPARRPPRFRSPTGRTPSSVVRI